VRPVVHNPHLQSPLDTRCLLTFPAGSRFPMLSLIGMKPERVLLQRYQVVWLMRAPKAWLQSRLLLCEKGQEVEMHLTA